MKYRWKLLLLLLITSVLPIVGLRTFGIHNVQLMAQSLVGQVQQLHDTESQNLLKVYLHNTANSIEKTRVQIETALMFQAHHIHQILLDDSRVAGGPTANITGANGDQPGGTDPQVKSQPLPLCYATPPDMEIRQARIDFSHLEQMLTVYRLIESTLGTFTYRHYTGLQNGNYTVYPCRQAPRAYRSNALEQFWYQNAVAEQLTAWSAPYFDPESGQAVMALSYTLGDEDDQFLGVTSLVVPVEVLLETALPVSSNVFAGMVSMACTLSHNPTTRKVGIQILAQADENEIRPLSSNDGGKDRWLTLSSPEHQASLMRDISQRRTHIRRMPYRQKDAFFIYAPLMHQGTTIMTIVPAEEVLKQSASILATIDHRLNRVKSLTALFLVCLITGIAIASFWFSRTVTRPLEALSLAARKLAGGDFKASVNIQSNDEFNEMGKVFNRVGPLLSEHYQIRQAMDVAMEIQQRLLPDQSPDVAGLDIYGMTLYSQKTGGDYFDYMCIGKNGANNLCVTIGDVVDHGIPSALLMANVRGMLRLRSTIGGKLSEIISDINRSFADDVQETGQFMTLFLARIDRDKHRIDWVRAGHDPAMIYTAAENGFAELKGRGIPLGIDKKATYEECARAIQPGEIILFGTDGIWETRNEAGEVFGKSRLHDIVRRHATESARTIVLSILDAVEDFRGEAEQEDDQTLVVVKVNPLVE